MQKKLRLKPADYVIIIVLLLAGAAGFWHNLQQGGRQQQKYIMIYLNNQPVKELSLADSDRLWEYPIAFGEDHREKAILQIEGGRVRMLPMPRDLCPLAICSDTGWISYSYESIVCLPNRIMVVFSSGPGHDNDIDGITR
jgi:hypothetical protein